jgi:hypothetical protein
MKVHTNSTKLMDKYSGLMNVKKIELTSNELRIKRKSVSWTNLFIPNKK